MRDQISSSAGLRSMTDSPRGSLFSDLLVAGPTNFNAADGRELYVKDFLLIDPELVASDPEGVLNTLQNAIEAHGGTRSISAPTSSSAGFFDIEEETNALYAQANFEYDIFRGNFGVRYLKTDITSVGNSITEDSEGNDLVSAITSTGDYDFFLPRINIVADVHDDVVVRAGWGKDIRRPDFDEMSTSVTFSTSPNPPVQLVTLVYYLKKSLHLIYLLNGILQKQVSLVWVYSIRNVQIYMFNKKKVLLKILSRDFVIQRLHVKQVVFTTLLLM